MLPSSIPPSRFQLRVLVIGGGLCGLATSIASLLAGHEVTVFESAAQLHEVGAGLQITPNGNRLLQKWGVSDQLASAAVAPATLSMRRFDGRLLAQRLGYDADITRKYGLGAEIHLGRRVQGVDYEHNAITLAGGETVRGDLIIAADGLWSQTRSSFLSLETPPKRTGDLAYRATLNAEDIHDPELRAVITNPALNIWIGPGMHAVGYNVCGGRLFNMVLLVPDDLPEGARKQPGNLSELRKIFENWDPILTKLIERVDKVEKWRLMHHHPLDRLCTDSGRFIMAGDSCHPMLPYFAQGANSSLEDAGVLGQLLSSVSCVQDLVGVGRIYENLRQRRVSRIHRETIIHRDEFHLLDGPEQIKRDEQLAQSFYSDSWSHPKIQPWLFSYDAYNVAEKACLDFRKDQNSGTRHLAESLI